MKYSEQFLFNIYSDRSQDGVALQVSSISIRKATTPAPIHEPAKILGNCFFVVLSIPKAKDALGTSPTLSMPLWSCLATHHNQDLPSSGSPIVKQWNDTCPLCPCLGGLKLWVRDCWWMILLIHDCWLRLMFWWLTVAGEWLGSVGKLAIGTPFVVHSIYSPSMGVAWSQSFWSPNVPVPRNMWL